MKANLINRCKRLPIALAIGATACAAMAQDVELYDRPDFRGARLSVHEQVPDLDQYGIGGRVASIVVNRGQWEMCTQPRFDGNCVTLGPGRYDNLPPALSGQVASVRQVEDRAPEAFGRWDPAGRPAVVLFENDDFRGPRMRISGIEPDLRARGFDNEARAVAVREGVWELCGQSDFRGRCLTFGPGRHVLPEWLAARVSSVRPVVSVGVREPAPRSDPVITLFDRRDLQGRWLRTTGALPNLDWNDYDNLARSVDVHSGRWELCSGREFSGECIVLRPGRHLLPQRFAGRVSSIRPVG